jgi:4-amino-4-deoxy-L-arabinose transferase-like glycosyltransferase
LYQRTTTTLNKAKDNLLASADNPKIGILLVIYVLAWALSHMVSDTNLDPYGDMLENFAWGQSFDWGQAKHPPLVGWITGAWFSVFPVSQISYHILAYSNAALGLAGIYVLGKRLGLARISLAATLVMCLALPYSTLAVKFNANTVLLPVWPWLVVAWLASQSTKGLRGIGFAALLGVLAALSLLGKYYSGVLLLTLGILTLGTFNGRRWLLTPYPWLALLACCVALAPHLYWLSTNDFATFQYVQDQGVGSVDVKQLAKFLLVPVVYWLLAWIAALICFPTRWPSSLWQSGLPKGKGDVLFWLAWLPYLLTLLFGITGFVSLSLPWAIPLGFAFSLLWYRNLSDGASDQTLVVMERRSRNIFLGWLGLVLLLSPVYAWQQGVTGSRNYYLPSQESALMLMALWNESQKDKMDWVAGDYPEAGLVAFYGDPGVRILEQLPVRPSASGAIFCPLGESTKSVWATPCTEAADRWASNREAQVLKIEYTVAKDGFRFFQDIGFRYRVYLYGR